MKAYLLLISLLVVLYIFYSASANDTSFDGRALEHFQDVGAWGWIVSVGNVSKGPADMAGMNISVYMTAANPDEYPPGFIDPNIAVGDHVSVYGSLQTTSPGDYHVLLVGSKNYFLKRDLI